MGERIRSDRPLIEPVYSQAGPNQAIELGTTVVEFIHKDKTYRKTAKITMEFLPSIRLLLAIPTEDVPEDNLWWFQIGNGLVDERYFELALIDKGVSLDVLCVGFGIDENALVLTPKRSPVTITPSSDSLHAVVFHLVNLPDFRGPQDYILTLGKPPLQGGKVCGRIILKADGWIVTIAATSETSDLVKALGTQGGYVITHMGRIEREDGSAFTTEQAESLLCCVHKFFSFALGRWGAVALPVGFDSDGNRVFEQWDLPLTATGPWNGSYSWFAYHRAEILSDVFPGFFALWHDSQWKEHLNAALYWYLAANDRSTGIGVDAGIILAQTALERLAWAYCVKDRKMVSEKAFESRALSADDKLRMLAASLDIPTELPKAMTALNARRGRKNDDIPDAITFVRNAVVHPSNGSSPEGSDYEAWELSMWLLDLTLLRLCGHNGRYGNRLVQRYAGTAEPVPWAKKVTIKNPEQ